ncbi:MAG: hypothetical protein ACM31E_02470, partial [Fibrobacterota bacterium]|nr:hypothetical protein [Chitinispirillaceae bacterium]
ALLIDEKDCVKLTIPCGIAAQEAVSLKHWATADKDALIAAKLDWEIVEKLPGFGATLIEAEGRWCAKRFEQVEARDKWKAVSPQAYELRDTLLHAFFYAYRKTASVYSKVQEIDENSGDEDMILDLVKLNHVGKENPDQLTAIGFDMKKVEEASTVAEAMQQLLAEADGTTPQYNEARKVRDQAYTLLKNAVDDVRACGQYVFYRDPARYGGYTSNYLRTHRSKSKASDGGNASAPAQAK